jgi:hypothetical protein
MWHQEEVLSVNQMVRQAAAFTCVAPAEFAGGWPDPFLVCGYERAGTIYYVLDSRQESPGVSQILAKDKALVPCPSYPNLASLYDYAVEKYRAYSAKDRRKGAKGKPSPAPPAAPPEKASGIAPDPAAVDAAATLLQAAGFEMVAPRRTHSIAALMADIVPALPAEVHALYTICDGGRCERLKLRVPPLGEAAELARTMAYTWPSMAFFPLVEADQLSHACCLATKGPLQGHVIFVAHDGRHAILARSLSRFFEILAANLAAEGWQLEDAMYGQGLPGSTPFEFAGNERTGDDLRAARALLELAEQRIGAADQLEEYRDLFEIALLLYSSRHTAEIAPLLQHRDREVRLSAQVRLKEMTTPEAAQVLADAELAEPV